ncbi:35410_t:CDS:2, partial [Gigaspora margarita]
LIASDLDITLVPLDFTDQIPFSPDVFDKLSKLKSFYGKFVYKLLSIIRDQIYDGQFVKSKTLTNSNFKAAIDAIVSKPIENSPFYQDFLNFMSKEFAP